MVDGQWGVCSISCDVSEDCTTKPTYLNPQREKCVFPFNYNDSPTYHCVQDEKYPWTPWCATATDENGRYTEWGRCDIICDTGKYHIHFI